MKMHRIGTALLLLVALGQVSGWCQLPVPIFVDVPANAPYYNQVNLLRERLITRGCSTDPQAFCPNTDLNGFPFYLTRGQAAVLIIRSLFSGLSGDPEGFTAPQSAYFSDVPSDHPQFAYIQKMKQLGITSGCLDGTQYCPDRELSYGELSVFVYRARVKRLAEYEYQPVPAPAACTSNPFPDVSTTHAFCPYIKAIYEELGPSAISTECYGGNFCPDVFFDGNGSYWYGLRARRGTTAFYLATGILDADYPHMLPTSNGQLDPVSRPGGSPDCNYEWIAFVNLVLPVGSQLYTYSQTSVTSISDADFWSFVLSPTLLEDSTVKYSQTRAIAGYPYWAELTSPLFTFDPAKNYRHSVQHEIASACLAGGSVSATTVPWPTILSVSPAVVYRGMTQTLAFRGINLQGTQSVAWSYPPMAPLSSNVSNVSEFGANITFTVPVNAPAGNSQVSLYANYYDGYSNHGTALALNPLNVAVADPTPVLNPLSTDSGEQGTPPLNMTLTGAYFGSNPRVCINGLCTNGSYTSTSFGGVTLAQGQCSACSTQIPITLTIASNATAGNYSLSVMSQGSMGNGFAPGPQGASQPQSASQTFQVQAVALTVSQVAKYNGEIVDVLYLSTGDSSGRIITTSVVPANIAFSVTYTKTLLSNPSSSCNADLTVPDGNATGFINSPVTAAQSGCSGIFYVQGRANNFNSLNSSAVVVSPQALIQMLYGEAAGQPRKANPDLVSQRAVGVAARNRFLQPQYFEGVSTYQAAITPGQFHGIATSILDGPDPELQAAAEVFSQTTSVSVENAGCFLSPDATEWGKIYTAYVKGDQVVPDIENDPGCYVRSAYGRQLIIKTSIGTNANGSGAPAFVFEQPRPSASAPAVIQIP